MFLIINWFWKKAKMLFNHQNDDLVGRNGRLVSLRSDKSVVQSLTCIVVVNKITFTISFCC